MAVMGVGVTPSHQDGQRLADHLVAGIAEQGQHGAVDVHDGAVLVGDHHALARRVQDGLELTLGHVLGVAVGLAQFLFHQVGGQPADAALAIGFLVGLIDQFQQRIDVDAAIGRGTAGLADLAFKQGMHQASPMVVTVMVWLCSSQRPVKLCGAISP